MNGEEVKIDVQSDKIEVDESKVSSSDVMTSNGVMHSIGEVLVPETLKGFIGGLAKQEASNSHVASVALPQVSYAWCISYDAG